MWIVRSTREHVEINNTEQLCRPYTTQWEFASVLSCGGPFSRITNISLPFVAVAERGRGATKGRGARLNIKVPQVVLLPSDSTSLMRPHAERTPVRPCITHGVGKVRGKTCRRKKAGQLLTLNRYTWHVMTDGYIHASCISTPLPPPKHPPPESVLFTRVMQDLFPHHFSFTESPPFSLYLFILFPNRRTERFVGPGRGNVPPSRSASQPLAV